MSLEERAQREYDALADEDHRKNRKPRIPNCEDFDFMTSDDSTRPVPIHELEIQREERRRRGYADRDTSKQEFAASLGIDMSDTRDPDSGHSVLEVTESIRSYYGDPEDEAYRTFRYNTMRVNDDLAFLKETTFVGSSIKSEHEQMQYFNRGLAAQRGGGVGHPDGSQPTAAPVPTGVDRMAIAQQLLESQYSRSHRETLRQYREQKANAPNEPGFAE